MTTYAGKDEITIKDLTFVPWITEDQIQTEIKRLAHELSEEYRDKNPILIGILSGAFIFCSDLVRNLDFYDCTIEFCRVASYEGTQSSGKVTELIGLKNTIKDRHIVFIEDVVDTGLTMHTLIESVKKSEPASIKICTLFYKPASLKVKIVPEFIGFTISPKFILGYGLDIDEYARNIRDIWVLKSDYSQYVKSGSNCIDGSYF